MGLLDLFKKEKNVSLSNSKEIIESDNDFNKEDMVINNKKFNIPFDILKLLWFVDGPLKNYSPAKGKTFEVEGIIISFSSFKTEEPSAISIKLPIKEVKDKNKVEKLGYYPSYGPNFLSTGLAPSQRWVYLDWLQNIEQEIDIGYVFLFYYGLERHLFIGDADSAFDMILRLRKFHKNKSFTYYTTNALIAASIFQKREDWFLKFFNTITDIEDVEVNDMYLLAKYVLKKGLTAKEIMKISKMVGFNNQRYIKDEKDLFEQELRKILIDTYSCEEMPLDRFKIIDSPRERRIILANYSLEDNQRMPEIPSLTKDKIFAETVKMLLEAAHENVKTILKYLRKNKESNFIVQKIDNRPKKKPDDVYKKSPIFKEIDINMFDENVRYYNEGICPNCKSKVDKRPVKKGKCSICKNNIIVIDSEFTGQKLILTEDEYNRMVNIRKERAYRKWVYKMLKCYDIEIKNFAKVVECESNDINKALIKVITQKAEEHYKNCYLGLYRNCLLDIGQIYERDENLEEALDMYLLVCYYDLLGCTNGSQKFENESAFLAPAVIIWIKKIAKKLNMNNKDIKIRFEIVVDKAKDKFPKKKIDDIWENIKNAIKE